MPSAAWCGISGAIAGKHFDAGSPRSPAAENGPIIAPDERGSEGRALDPGAIGIRSCGVPLGPRTLNPRGPQLDRSQRRHARLSRRLFYRLDRAVRPEIVGL